MHMNFGDIPFHIDTGHMLTVLGLNEYFYDEIDPLAEKANAIGKPKAIVRKMSAGSFDEGSILIGETMIKSRLVSSLLRNAGDVFCYVVTCGKELEGLMEEISDPVEQMWQARINQEALRQAQRHVAAAVEERFHVKSLCSVNPGSNPDWPLSAQIPLFDMLGDVEGSTGVVLTDSLLMLPTKSVSGIWFSRQEKYENCRICHREDCMGRRSEFDKHLYDQIFAAGAI